MTDHFAVLGIDRSALLSEDLIRKKFHELSRELHPDATHGDQTKFAQINEAQRVLRSPSARLRHLLELNGDAEKLESAAAMSDELMDLFADLSEVFSKADALIAKRNSAGSAVAKALLAGEEMAVQQSLMGAGGKLIARRKMMESGLKNVGVGDCDALALAAHELAFLEKWQRQVQERIGALI